MSDFLQSDGPAAPVPPLKSLKKNGERYSGRSPNVETQLGRIRAVPPSTVVPEVPRLYDESIFHMLRHGEDFGEELQAALWKEFAKRIERQIRLKTRRLPKDVVEDIVKTVQLQIIEPLMKEKAGEAVEGLDFLEVGFAEAVRSKMYNGIRGHKRSAGSMTRVWLETEETGVDGKKFKRPLELVPDSAASPEDAAIQTCMMEKAAAAVEDPRQWEALDLHYLQGTPIRQIKATRGEVQHRLKYGIKAIRRAFGLDGGEEGGAK